MRCNKIKDCGHNIVILQLTDIPVVLQSKFLSDTNKAVSSKPLWHKVKVVAQCGE